MFLFFNEKAKNWDIQETISICFLPTKWKTANTINYVVHYLQNQI